MQVIDLFAGTGSATQAFADAGHDVFRVEMDPTFDAALHADIRYINLDDLPAADFIWASPPCTSFSVASLRYHWDATTNCRTCGAKMQINKHRDWSHPKNNCERNSPGKKLTYTPKSDTAALGLELLRQTLWIIFMIQPRWWIIENPRAIMRKMTEMEGIDRRTITHCQYGDPRRMKPTDLFGVFPRGFDARACRNGDSCHEAAPRGASTGTQGLSAKEAAMLPPMLGRELLAAMEAELRLDVQSSST